MTTTTHERLRRTAAEAVGSIPGIEAVVLYGSRARGTTRATSDWDVAILSHAAPDDEEAATRLLGKLERVYPVVMKPESIEAHCNQGTRLESAIARQGRLLAGEWTPPRCRIENLDVNPEDLKRNLDTATDDLRSAFLVLCEAAFNGLLYVPKVVEESQQAAEALAKTVIAGFGLSPATVHDLDVLATQLENAYRGRARGAEERKRFAAAIRELDGNTRAASKGPPASASANATERGASPSMWQCVKRTAPARSCLSISPGRASRRRPRACSSTPSGRATPAGPITSPPDPTLPCHVNHGVQLL